MLVLNDTLLASVSEQARGSERLRMNFNLHDSPDAKAQRLLNALEPGTVLPIHRHRHTLEVLESGSVIFEVKDGPYTPLKAGDVL
ncbi:MAG: WbuC family cupin fold metalloprotein [Bacteroidales bacterium]